MVRRNMCPSCEVTMSDMNDPATAQRARDFGIKSVPAVFVNGKVAACCAGRGPDEATLQAAGLGRPLPR